MLRLLTLLGGAYALYRRFQGSRPSTALTRPAPRPAANRTADAGPRPAPAGRKAKSEA